MPTNERNTRANYRQNTQSEHKNTKDKSAASCYKTISYFFTVIQTSFHEINTLIVQITA